MANEWIVFGEEFSQDNGAKKQNNHGFKSCICKFSQAKLKAIAQRRVKATSAMVRGIKKKEVKNEPCEPAILPVQEETNINEGKPSEMGKSINDVKRDVSKSFQAWVQFPETIKTTKIVL